MSIVDEEGEGGLCLGLPRHAALEVEETCAWILQNNFNRVALQVPDHLLHEAAGLSHSLQRRCKELGKQNELCVFIMADTIDGSCHVDEITADHLTAECVVHYGAIYIPQVNRLPVRFVLEKAEGLDVERLAAGLASGDYDTVGHGASGDKEGKNRIVVAFELKYEHEMAEAEAALRRRRGGEGGPHENEVVFARACLKEQRAGQEEGDGGDGGGWHELGGLRWPSPSPGQDRSCRYVWVGENPESLALTNAMLCHNQSDWFRYDPVAGEWHAYGSVSTASRTLRRRYFLVEKAKDASIVGIVVGTLTIAGYLEALGALRRVLAKAGKKSYTFVMGRITPEKLANYPEVEVFVLISCPQLALLDSRDFYAPVITPYEAVLAFVPNKEWTGEYNIGFGALLGLGSEESEEENGGGDQQQQEEEPTFSLIRGGYREAVGGAGAGAAAIGVNVIDQTASLQLSSVGGREVVEVRTAADYVSKVRTYTGIETPASGAEVKEPMRATEGRAGRAAKYDEGGEMRRRKTLANKIN